MSQVRVRAEPRRVGAWRRPRQPGLLVQRPWVVDRGLDAEIGEVTAQGVALRHADHVLVDGVTGASR